jgi:hypothetical protein
MSAETKPPPVIYLQWNGDQKPSDEPVDPADVTWCKEKFYPHDVPYRRMGARTHPTIGYLQQRAEAAEAKLSCGHPAAIEGEISQGEEGCLLCYYENRYWDYVKMLTETYHKFKLAEAKLAAIEAEDSAVMEWLRGANMITEVELLGGIYYATAWKNEGDLNYCGIGDSYRAAIQDAIRCAVINEGGQPRTSKAEAEVARLRAALQAFGDWYHFEGNTDDPDYEVNTAKVENMFKIVGYQKTDLRQALREEAGNVQGDAPVQE